MAHAAAIDPIVLVGLLLGVVSLVGWTIKRMAMRRVPHPIAARRGRRARGGVAGNKRRAGRGCGRRGCIGGWGVGHPGLVVWRGGVDAAARIISIRK